MLKKNLGPYPRSRATIFQSIDFPCVHMIPTTRDVRDLLAVTETYRHIRDRIDYMNCVGVDYHQAMKYVDEVEKLNRRYYDPGDRLWNHINF